MRHHRFIFTRGSACLFVLLFTALAFSADVPPSTAADPLLSVMKRELKRASSGLAKADPAPYYIGYSVTDQRQTVIYAAQGALYNSLSNHRRLADVTVRVGSAQLDNTHGEGRYSGLTSGSLPLENEPNALSHTLWQLTDREYKKASQSYLTVKANAGVRAKEEDDSPDFSDDTAQVHAEVPGTELSFDQKSWEDKVRRFSARFRAHPEVTAAMVILQIDDTRHFFASSDGSEVSRPEKVVRLMIEAEKPADDGMQLMRAESFLAGSPDKLPSEEEINSKIDRMASDLERLHAAPVAEPFSGPALLSGRSAAVFFHEVLGHRLEGQRQRGDEEGQTFAKKINQPILPDFLSVVDDPTKRQLGNVELAGWYTSDEQGEPAQRVALIQNGILKTFLMSRMPVKGVGRSNGHGRAQEGYLPTGRQGNLIVESSRSVPEKDMRQKLIDEIKKQGKPYGLYFEDIEGGFTLTGRQLPQAFQVLPVMVWRVYPDGRPDELVRGVDIVGTPLAALGHITVTGDVQHVFNGICGAESGNIPVSAAAPAMLFSEIEVQRKDQSHDRPPILPPPPLPNSAKNVAEVAR